jgi:hypothetical protein
MVNRARRESAAARASFLGGLGNFDNWPAGGGPGGRVLETLPGGVDFGFGGPVIRRRRWVATANANSGPGRGDVLPAFRGSLALAQLPDQEIYRDHRG